MLRKSVAVVVVIVLIAINLRPPMAGIGPLFDQIQAATGISNLIGSLLTTLPIALIGLGAAFGYRLRRSLGERDGISLGVVFIAIAALLRGFWHSPAALLITALLAGIGIALVQVLMTSFAKRYFPRESSKVMAIYTTGIMAGAAAGAMLATPFANLWGWSGSLAAWALPAFAALLFWPFVTRNLDELEKRPSTDILASERGKLLHLEEAWGNSTSDDTGDLLLELSAALPSGIRSRCESRRMNFAGNLRAWQLMLYFGISTAAFTLVLAWLPPYYLELGKSEAFSGTMLGVLTLFEVASGFIVSASVHRFPDRRVPLWIATALLAAGFVLLLTAPLSFAYLIVMCLGLGSGALFPLALIVALDHLTNADEAGALSDFVQGGGYLFASLAPVIGGLVRDSTSSLVIAWWVILALVALMFAMTWLFSPTSYHRIEGAAGAPRRANKKRHNRRKR